MEKSKKKTIYSVLMVIFLVIFIASAAYIGNYLINSRKQKAIYNQLKIGAADLTNNEDEYTTQMMAHYRALKDENPDFVGWIKVDGTNIDYPVMQTQEHNEFYLYRNFKKEDSINGSIFADLISTVYPPSDNILLHGHNMKDGSMFATMLRYRDESFYQQYPTIQFDTLDGLGTYQIISVFRVDVSINSPDYKYYNFGNAENAQEFDDYVKNVKALSYYDTGHTASYGDKLITLSTCEFNSENGRLVIVAKRIK